MQRETVLARLDELVATLAAALRVPAQDVRVESVLEGSSVVTIAVVQGANATEASTGRLLAANLQTAFDDPVGDLQTIFGAVRNSLRFIWIAITEPPLPTWVLYSVPIVLLVVTGTTVAYLRRKTRHAIDRALYRPAEPTVAVRHGRLYVDGEAVVPDHEYFQHEAFACEDQIDAAFKAEANRLTDGNHTFQCAADSTDHMEIVRQWQTVIPVRRLSSKLVFMHSRCSPRSMPHIGSPRFVNMKEVVESSPSIAFVVNIAE